MSIKGYIDELNKIKNEIDRNNKINKQLKTRMKELNDAIAEYLKNKQQTGIKYNNQAIIIEQKSKIIPKKKKDIENDMLLVLKSLGLNDPRQALNELESVRNNGRQNQDKIKLKNLKSKI
tara:strand:- start:1573 stop:1932 length:360 start_codon:yes stop_codon:yes gene_type:complete